MIRTMVWMIGILLVTGLALGGCTLGLDFDEAVETPDDQQDQDSTGDLDVDPPDGDMDTVDGDMSDVSDADVTVDADIEADTPDQQMCECPPQFTCTPMGCACDAAQGFFEFGSRPGECYRVKTESTPHPPEPNVVDAAAGNGYVLMLEDNGPSSARISMRNAAGDRPAVPYTLIAPMALSATSEFGYLVGKPRDGAADDVELLVLHLKGQVGAQAVRVDLQREGQAVVDVIGIRQGTALGVVIVLTESIILLSEGCTATGPGITNASLNTGEDLCWVSETTTGGAIVGAVRIGPDKLMVERMGNTFEMWTLTLGTQPMNPPTIMTTGGPFLPMPLNVTATFLAGDGANLLVGWNSGVPMWQMMNVTPAGMGTWSSIGPHNGTPTGAISVDRAMGNRFIVVSSTEDTLGVHLPGADEYVSIATAEDKIYDFLAAQSFDGEGWGISLNNSVIDRLTFEGPFMVPPSMP